MSATPSASSGNSEEARLHAVGEFITARGTSLLAAAALVRDAGEGSVIGEVVGTSMGQALAKARVRIVCEAQPPPRGAVVAFVSGDRRLVHRVHWRGIMGRARRWMIMKGDAVVLPDLPALADDVLGRVDAMACGAGWQRLPERHRMPRRDRLLSQLVLGVSAVLLEIHPRLARWFIEKLWAAEGRQGWVHRLLYGRGGPRRAASAPRASALAMAAAVRFCRLGARVSRALRAHPTLPLHALLARGWDSAQRLFGAICSEALSLDEKGRLTILIYDFFPGSHRSNADALYPWEVPWFGLRLPQPPCRVLVGASGIGREAVWLERRGYAVDAFEPAPALVAETRRSLGEGAHVYQLAYETLNAVLLDGAPDAAASANGKGLQGALADARYDVLILGSGSLTHVLDRREHLRVFQASALLCPRGPILASFFCADDQADRIVAGRAARWGGRVGRAISALRKMESAGNDGLVYRPHYGFGYVFTRAEIEQHARAIGRTAAWEPATADPFRRVTCVTLLANA